MSETNSEQAAFEIFPWNRNFETGIELIDQQHKKLVEILNRLAWYFTSSSADLSCNHLLEELLDYARTHFAEEEAIWAGYFGSHDIADNHHRSHQLFFEQVADCQQSRQGEGETLKELFDFLTRWLAFHILESDRRMAIMARALEAGASVDQARAMADEKLSGSGAVLVTALLEIYSKLSDSTIHLMQEKAARLRAEDELARLKRQQLNQALEEQAGAHQKQLEFLAYYDGVTGLLNRNGMLKCVRRLLDEADMSAGAAALISIDLDNFREINRRCGEDNADRYLGLLSRRWRDTLFTGGALARISGDEFAVAVADSRQVESQLEALRLTAAQSCDVDGEQVFTSFTAGVVLFPAADADRTDADTLMRQADHMLFRAKEKAKGQWLYFDAEVHLQHSARQALIEGIRQGLAAGEFELYYQPKVNLVTRELIGVEALIRWNHPERGLLAPGHFLPAIENHPLSLDVDRWVLEQALVQMWAWDQVGLVVDVGVNICGLQMQQPEFVASLRELLARFPDVDPRRLDLEILETSSLSDLHNVSGVIEGCRALGVSFSLDDFGTGYSSLSYLKHLPVQTLKIDQGFVRDALDNADDISIIKGIIGLSRAFGMNLIAEGAETPKHGDVLVELGCYCVQGYAIARPMPAGELLAWQQQWKRRPASSDSQGSAPDIRN